MPIAQQFGVLLGAVLIMGIATASEGATATTAIIPETLSRIATIDDRFQSYNLEMAEVIGGNFWEPYPKTTPATPREPSTKFAIGQGPGDVRGTAAC
jgi:hypothetical protein